MALVACFECGSEVSDIAAVCPKCGVANPSGKKPPVIFTANIGFGKRFAACLLDMVIIMIPFNIVEILLFGFGAYDINDPAYFKALIFSIMFVLAYDVGMWTFADGATVGKKIMKIKIVKNDGSPLTIGSAFLRYISYIIVSIPCGLGVLAVLWDKEKRGWHDKMANTKVIPAV